jgi:predicted nucleic acid-binding Zn ribbon protein
LTTKPQRRRKVTSMRQALRSLLRSWGVDGKVRENQAVALWSQVVGARIAEKTEALRVEDGKIFIRVLSSSWKTELIFVKSEIIQRLNQALGGRVLKDIVFVGGGRRSDAGPEAID